MVQQKIGLDLGSRQQTAWLGAPLPTAFPFSALISLGALLFDVEWKYGDCRRYPDMSIGALFLQVALTFCHAAHQMTFSVLLVCSALSYFPVTALGAGYSCLYIL